ncbi:MAG: hypothetical protein U5L05_03815 [Rubrivivax sp.]|nr:hypothetical protein [Rubrivivax sp.]
MTTATGHRLAHAEQTGGGQQRSRRRECADELDERAAMVTEPAPGIGPSTRVQLLPAAIAPMTSME